MTIASWFSTLLDDLTKPAASSAPTLTVSTAQSDATKALNAVQNFITNARVFFTNADAEQKVEAGLADGLDIVQIATMIDPAIGVAVLPIQILEAIVPWLFAEAAIPLVKVNGTGGASYVTQTWANDPRHALKWNSVSNEWEFSQ